VYSIIGVNMSINIYVQIAAYVALTAALISSIFWIFLSYTWWRSEKKRIKKSRELNNI
jgi:uncharacterized membrane protein